MKKQKSDKMHVSVVVIGHVDSGKSTTTGHFVYGCGAVDKRTIDKFEKEAAEIGKASFRFAWILDKTSQERSRGITIDCTTTSVETEKLQCTLIDAPGHGDFMKNMISGASHADYGVFVVPASPGEFETATGTQGEFVQQATLAKTMGINYGIVAINKMDSHNYEQARYNEIAKDVKDRLKKIGFKPTNLAYIPISGLAGDNIMEPSDKMPWYKGWKYDFVLPDRTVKTVSGKTFYDYINTLNQPPRADNKPLRGSVSEVFKIPGVGTVTTGRIDSGVMRVNDLLRIVPGDITAEIKSIEMHHVDMKEARPGDNVGFNLKNVQAASVHRGCVFGHANSVPPCEVVSFQAQVIALEKIGDDRGIRAKMAPTMDVHTAHIPVVIAEVINVDDKKKGKKGEAAEKPAEKNVTAEETVSAEKAVTAEEGVTAVEGVTPEQPAKPPGGYVLRKNDSGLVEIVPQKPLCVEVYTEFPPLGRFSLRDSRMTIGVGVIRSVVQKEFKGKQAGAGKAKQAAKGGGKKGNK